MALAHINLSFKQYFNFMCRTDFERRMFHDTYSEFQKASKIYSFNNTLHTYKQMLQANPKAIALQERLNFVVMNTLGNLDNKMPNVQDTSGKSILFDLAELTIHSSDLLNKAGHVICVTYTSPKLVLHEIIDDVLLVSYDGKIDTESFMIKLSSEIAINYHENAELVYS
ncbi:hypothetical protein ACJVDK_15530 [Pedobacter sp. MW01-1-1]